MVAPLYIGCAGWSLRESDKAYFSGAGSHLERYASELSAVEVNSSFYRSHRATTWARWAGSTPDDFRFSVKLPRTITHERRLLDAAPLVETFLSEVTSLGKKLGPVLIQLPPSFGFEASLVDRFLQQLRDQHTGPLVCEPRHPTWFTGEAAAMLVAHRVALAAVDPPPQGAPELWPGGFADVTYFRLHGSPKMYYSDYSDDRIASLAEQLKLLRDSASELWCIFDNTAEGHAIPNALTLRNIARTADIHVRRSITSRH